MMAMTVKAPYALAAMDGGLGYLRGTLRLPPGRYALHCAAWMAPQEALEARAWLAARGVEPPAWRECVAAAGSVLGDIWVEDCLEGEDGLMWAAVRDPRRIAPVPWRAPPGPAAWRVPGEPMTRCREAREEWRRARGELT